MMKTRIRLFLALLTVSGVALAADPYPTIDKIPVPGYERAPEYASAEAVEISNLREALRGLQMRVALIERGLSDAQAMATRAEKKVSGMTGEIGQLIKDADSVLVQTVTRVEDRAGKAEERLRRQVETLDFQSDKLLREIVTVRAEMAAIRSNASFEASKSEPGVKPSSRPDSGISTKPLKERPVSPVSANDEGRVINASAESPAVRFDWNNAANGSVPEIEEGSFRSVTMGAPKKAAPAAVEAMSPVEATADELFEGTSATHTSFYDVVMTFGDKVSSLRMYEFLDANGIREKFRADRGGVFAIYLGRFKTIDEARVRQTSLSKRFGLQAGIRDSEGQTW